jgi:hypothetical protein
MNNNYKIGKMFYYISIDSPLATVFQDFPKDFSMLFSVKINKGLTGYLVTLSDITGIQKIAIQYGDMTLLYA